MTEENNMTVDSLFDDDENIIEEGEEIVEAVEGEGEATDNVVAEGEAVAEEQGAEGEAVEETGEENEDPAKLTGVERFLTDFGIVGGEITYEDGESVNFYELSDDEQYTILQELSSGARPTIEDEYDLDDTEVQLLNAIRNSGGTVEDYIGNLINDQVNKSMTLRDAVSVDYKNMPDDAIYLKWISEVNPEMTQDEALEALETQKKNETLYRGQVDSLRGQYVQLQNDEAARLRQEAENERFSLLEDDRREIVSVVESIDNISGAEITPYMKNEVLHSLLEINDQGDPLIMEEMFSNPEKLFKAAWFMKYGESYMDNVDKFWRKRESESYKRGRMDLLNGAPESPDGMARNNVIPRPGNNEGGGRRDKPSSIDALWED
jgi:hypothetical protein